MLVDASTVQALAIAAAVGALAGLIGGYVASADSLFGALLLGVIGGVSLSAIFRLGGVPPMYAVGSEEFSLVWAAVGGLLLGFVVGRSNA